jgi:hypothetical protein
MTKIPDQGHSGVQPCGDWCRHFELLDQDRWEGFGRCVHPLSLRSGQVFSTQHECWAGTAEVDLEEEGTRVIRVGS